MAFSASETASCTIAAERAWEKGLGGATVVCMIALQSVTASACTGLAATRIHVATIGMQSRLLMRFILACPFLGQRVPLERTGHTPEHLEGFRITIHRRWRVGDVFWRTARPSRLSDEGLAVVDGDLGRVPLFLS